MLWSPVFSSELWGEVQPSASREYGRARLQFIDSMNPLLTGVSKNTQVWMSHGDTITAIPDNFKIIASTADINRSITIENLKSFGTTVSS